MVLSLPLAKVCPFLDFVLEYNLVLPIKIEIRMTCFKMKYIIIIYFNIPE